MTPVRMSSEKTTENSVAERRLSTAAPATVPKTRPAMTMPKERQLIDAEVADGAEEREAGAEHEQGPWNQFRVEQHRDRRRDHREADAADALRQRRAEDERRHAGEVPGEKPVRQEGGEVRKHRVSRRDRPS